MTRAVVFANGDCSDYACSQADITQEDFLVCVDGGARHCFSQGLQPDLLVGDLDSLSPKLSKVIKDAKIECVRFPPEKDTSDLELTLEVLSDRFFEDIVLLGMSGGRTDHHLFNWQLAGSRPWPFKLRLIDDTVDAQLVDKSRPLQISASIGQTFSVIPLVQDAMGVHVSGAKYPLSNARVPVGSTLGLSNEVTDSRLQVSVETGIVLVMLVHFDG